MHKRISVDLETRAHWLQRFESGETPPKIAEKDNVDVRTVRRHIDIARIERDGKGARAAVVQGALERHFADLCEIAQRIDSAIGSNSPVPQSLQTERLYAALKKHVPATPLWKLLSKWDRVQSELAGARTEMAEQAKKAVATDRKLQEGLLKKNAKLADDLQRALTFNAGEWASGGEGLLIQRDWKESKEKDRAVRLDYGSIRLGEVESGEKELVKSALEKLEIQVKQSPEFDILREVYLRLFSLKVKLQDELAVIILRRVVPGRCQYCPV